MNKNKQNTAEIAVIGAGIVGVSIAGLLSEYGISVLLIEKSDDVCTGATRANSGIVHGGYTAKAGTLKGELAIRGNRMYGGLAERLGFPYRKIGSYVLAFTEDEEHILHDLLENGLKNDVSGLEILSSATVCKHEPRITSQFRAALYSPETGIVSPYEAGIAMAENAIANGTRLSLSTEVRGLEKQDDGFRIHTNRGTLNAEIVINAAGIYADLIENLLGLKTFSLTPRKGEYMVFRRGAAAGIHSVLFRTPTSQGKGVLVSPTCWNNLIVGPNVEKIPQKEDRSTSPETLRNILSIARKTVPDLKAKDIIRVYAGLRPTPNTRDFIIEETAVPGFINVAGIESPGLTAAPAIAEMVFSILCDTGAVSAAKKRNLLQRAAIQPYYSLRPIMELRADIDREMGDPARLVCRCEQVREAQIKDALSRNIPIHSMDAVKLRTRAGMGACQGQFCGPRVRAYIEQHNGHNHVLPAHTPPAEILKAVRALD